MIANRAPIHQTPNIEGMTEQDESVRRHSLRQVQSYLCHTTIAMTMRYSASLRTMEATSRAFRPIVGRAWQRGGSGGQRRSVIHWILKR